MSENTAKSLQEVMEALVAPFPASAIYWKPQATTKDKIYPTLISVSESLNISHLRAGFSIEARSRCFWSVQRECQIETSIPVGIQPSIPAITAAEPAGTEGITKCLNSAG